MIYHALCCFLNSTSSLGFCGHIKQKSVFRLICPHIIKYVHILFNMSPCLVPIVGTPNLDSGRPLSPDYSERIPSTTDLICEDIEIRVQQKFTGSFPQLW